jgi:hypothetical protein
MSDRTDQSVAAGAMRNKNNNSLNVFVLGKSWFVTRAIL